MSCQIVIDPKNTVCGVKRLLGCNFSDRLLQREMKRWGPAKISGDTQDRPVIEVKHLRETKLLRPEDVLGAILFKLKRTAEDFLDQSVITNVVISMPNYFFRKKRQFLRAAASIAGLNVLRIITDSSAAAMDFGFDHFPEQEKETVLTVIFDFGAAHLNVSTCRIRKQHR